MAKNTEKSNIKKSKNWIGAVLIIAFLLMGLVVYSNIQRAKNQREAAKIQLEIQRKTDKNDCYLKAAQQSKNEYYDEATDGPAIAACDQKYGN